MSQSAPTLPTDVPVRPPRRRWVAPNLRFFLLLLALLLAIFTLLRAGLIVRNWQPSAATPGQIAVALLIGIRFDLVAATYVALPVMVACYVPWTAPWRGTCTRRAFVWAVTVFLTIVSFVLLAEWEFFNEFQSRFNELAIRYFDHPAIVGGMIWYNYPVIRYLLGSLALAAVIYVALRAAVSFAYGGTDVQRPRQWAVETGGLLAIIFILVIGMRGGMQGQPLRWGDAFQGTSEFANQMGLNGLYSLANASRDMVTRGKVAGRWAGKIDLRSARNIVRRMVVAPGERLLDPDGRTVLRQGDVGSNLTLVRPDGKPLNVVVVMMESFSARFVGACGAPRSFTPAFDALTQDGMLFDHAFSAGTHTHQGIFATQLGFPNLPGFETLMQSSVANQHFLSLANIFHDRNYKTFFLYNGDFAWDNMRGFFAKQGVDVFVGGDDMRDGAKFLDPVWGVSDGDLFDRANKEFEAAAKTGPFYAQIMTLSNHAPFEVPPVPNTAPITDMRDYNKRLEAMRYADYAMGKFIEEAKKMDYFKNTLFVFVGDHGFNVSPVLTEVQLLYHHVPLLFYAPLLTDRRNVDHRVASQVDIVPTILGLLGIKDGVQASWGRSLFNDDFAEENFAVFKMSGGGRAVALAQGDKLLILGSAAGKPLLMTYNLGPQVDVEPLEDAAAEKRMERDLRAYLQAGLDDLKNFRAGATSDGN